jgi:hypothetical protein
MIAVDTLPAMVKAQRLYKSGGFHEIAPYRQNPALKLYGRKT